MSQGALPIDLIRRPATPTEDATNPLVYGQRYFAMASLRILLSDTAAELTGLPTVTPTVPVPLDDSIHRVPFAIPSIPYVVPHGGKEPLGWSADGRWLVYYHPGDISDAWADGHSGVSAEIYNGCYQLGANVFNYGHVEYSKWLQLRGKGK